MPSAFFGLKVLKFGSKVALIKPPENFVVSPTHRSEYIKLPFPKPAKWDGTEITTLYFGERDDEHKTPLMAEDNQGMKEGAQLIPASLLKLLSSLATLTSETSKHHGL